MITLSGTFKPVVVVDLVNHLTRIYGVIVRHDVTGLDAIVSQPLAFCRATITRLRSMLGTLRRSYVGGVVSTMADPEKHARYDFVDGTSAPNKSVTITAWPNQSSGPGNDLDLNHAARGEQGQHFVRQDYAQQRHAASR